MDKILNNNINSNLGNADTFQDTAMQLSHSVQSAEENIAVDATPIEAVDTESVEGACFDDASSACGKSCAKDKTKKAKKTQSQRMVKMRTEIKSKLTLRFSTAYIAKIAILTAIAFILYAFVKFPLPFAFPSFLDMQFSELPALLAGFSMGPVSGAIVIILKCLFKLPMSGTGYVGELTDIIMGLAFVVPASIIYRRHKDIKHAVIGLGVSTVIVVVSAVIINRFISIPFYVEMLFGGNWQPLLGMLRPIYKNVTVENFYSFYLGLGVVPFNILRFAIVSLMTFMVYKRLSKLLHWEGTSLKKHSLSGSYKSESIEDTYEQAEKIADTLKGGEILLLEGDLGAGKTTFTKGLATALGVSEEITSPTFTILNVYESGRLRLNHLDMYRIEREEDLVELGVEDAIAQGGVTVVEWNKLEHLTGRIINVKIENAGESSRTITISDSADAVIENKNHSKRAAKIISK